MFVFLFDITTIFDIISIFTYVSRLFFVENPCYQIAIVGELCRIVFSKHIFRHNQLTVSIIKHITFVFIIK